MSKIGGTYEIREEIITQAYPYRVAQKTSKERSWVGSWSQGRQRRERTTQGIENCRAKQAIIYLENTGEACQAKEMGKCWGKSKRWAIIGERYQTMMFPKFQIEDYILYL